MRKKITFSLLLLLLTGVLTACGISKEQSQAIETAEDSLNNARYRAETNYGTLTDDTLGTQIAELGKKTDQIKQTGIHKMNEQEAEEFLKTITDITTNYGVLQASIDEEAQKEKQEAKKKEETQEVPVYICNKTGRTLTMIKVTDLSLQADTMLLPEGQVLGTDQILLGGTVNVQKGSNKWQITATDDTNQTLLFDNLDLSGAKAEGMSLTLETIGSGNTVKAGSYVSKDGAEQNGASQSSEADTESSNQ